MKYIIEGKRWFEKTNGNTYHTVRILDTETGNEIYKSPITYGYDEQYIQTAIKFLNNDKISFNTIREFAICTVSDVGRKRDL